MLWPQESDASATVRTDHPRSGRRFASANASRQAALDRETPERSLVARVLAGDVSSFLDLVSRHHGSMVRIAEAWGHDAEGAEQAARSAWRAILERLSAFDAAGSLTAWLLRVASDLASATAPERPADAADDDAVVGFESTTFDREGRWASSARPGIAAGTVADVPPDALHEALAALPPRERVVITLRDIEGLGPDDAAAVLGVTMAAQHALLHRARTAVVRQIWSAGRRADETRRTGREGA